MDFWYQQVFCHPLYYVKKTLDMGFGLFARDTIAYDHFSDELHGFLEVVDLKSNPWALKIPSIFIDREGNEYILYGPQSLLNNNVGSYLKFTNINVDGRTCQNVLERHSVAYVAVDSVDDMEIVEECSETTIEVHFLDAGMVTEELASTQDVDYVEHLHKHWHIWRKPFYALRLTSGKKADDSVKCEKNHQILVNYGSQVDKHNL